MKTSLKIIALLIAAGYPVVALAESAGIAVPTISPSAVLGLFVGAFLGLTLFADYSRRVRSLTVSAPVIVPPSGVFVTKSAAKSECLAA